MLKRRTLLLTGAGVAATAAVGALSLRERSNRQRLKEALAGLVPPPREIDHNGPTGSLSDAEAATVAALGEILLPPDPGLDAGNFVRAHVARRCQEDPGYLTEYRGAARLLDERTATTHAGKHFADLSAAERDEVLRSLLWSYSGRRFVGATGRALENVTISSDALALRRIVVADVLTAFYSSPRGWAVVGYAHYPGVPAADPRDYTRPLGA